MRHLERGVFMSHTDNPHRGESSAVDIWYKLKSRRAGQVGRQWRRVPFAYGSFLLRSTSDFARGTSGDRSYDRLLQRCELVTRVTLYY